MSQVPGRQRHRAGTVDAAPGTKAAQRPRAAGSLPATAGGLRPDTSTPDGLTLCNGGTCQARVRWVVTLAGARMPINPDPDPDGNVIRVVLEDGSVRARVLTGAELPAQQTAWMPHWRTCPDSQEFRKRRTRTAPACRGCGGPMDPVLARAERWTTHPSCDPAGVIPRPAREDQ